MSLVAAVDCGTNTIRLLIADLPEVLVRESRMVRLGEDLEKTGRISEPALVRAYAALDEFASLISSHEVTQVRFCATSATRDAYNAPAFLEGVAERLGVIPEVITGEEEARLTCEGALRALRGVPDAPVLVVDIGGGSTELVLTGPEGFRAVSLDMGSVRMHERHFHADPPTPEQVVACQNTIDALLDTAGLPWGSAVTVVGVGGTATTVGAGVMAFPDQTIPPYWEVAVPDVQVFIHRLLAMPTADRRGFPWLDAGRADVIGVGALILSRVLRRTGAETLVVSQADILDGIAWSMVEGSGVAG